MVFFARLLEELNRCAFEIHIAQPEYRKLFSMHPGVSHNGSGCRIPGNRLHLSRDRCFYYANDIDVNRESENIRLSLVFQREVIHHLIPSIQPDIIHCHDWMTGILPAVARRLGIPCVFTIYDTRSQKIPLWLIEETGIDAAWFWKNLFYDRMPVDYEETRWANPADFLMSGIHAADYVSAASEGFRAQVLGSRSRDGSSAFGRLLKEKYETGCLSADCSGKQALALHIGIYRKLLVSLSPAQEQQMPARG